MDTEAVPGRASEESRRSRIARVAAIILATVLCFLRLGTGDLKEWDESRNGVNAYEMLRTGDPINLYYNGELDTWNAKPPLMIWLIAGSYKLFGYNEWALRAPAAICGIAFFAVLYALIRRLTDYRTALLTCLILCCCKAVIDHHVFRSGDFDGLLLLLLTASIYAFVRYLEDGNAWCWDGPVSNESRFVRHRTFKASHMGGRRSFPLLCSCVVGRAGCMGQKHAALFLWKLKCAGDHAGARRVPPAGRRVLFR